MKLLNQSIKHLSISIFVIVSIWSVIFYINMQKEIRSSMDEGLENYKRLIIQNAKKDSTILTKNYFDASFFTLRTIEEDFALSIKDRYIDTIIYMQDYTDPVPEPELVRMLITAFKFNEDYYELRVANSMVEKEDMIRTMFLNTIWLYFVLIIGILIVNNLILKKLWRPFYELLGKLKAFRIGDNEEFPEIKTKTQEFQDLQKAARILINQNKETFEQQKQFIGNASHELQTPLAIATHKLELLLEDKNLETNQAENIAEIYQIIQRMIQLNKSLLLLSKIENKQFIANGIVSVNELVKESIEELSDYADYKEIRFEVEELSPLSLNANPDLAQIVISNLLRNAIFHNVKNGVVHIQIDKERIEICNTGETTALDPEMIFNRFYKSNSDTKGTGLGLAIVKAILDLYGYEITYKFENNLHCIEIQF